MVIIIASNNNGKIKEFKEILEPLGYNVLSQREAGINIDVEETGTTFEQNAEIKARAIYELKHTAVLADDSGLTVDYLNGEPGVYSARYMGLESDEEKRKCILEKLKNVPQNKRTASFACSICFIKESGEKIIVTGIWKGKITEEEQGENGFGYDSIFQPEGEEKTSAEMLPQEKNSKSHRALAIQKLKKYI